MPYDPKVHHRSSVRLQGYDYSQPGAYFITIVARDRLCLFGNIVEGSTTLNPAGEMLESCWSKLPEKFPHVRIDAHIVMPNHFHDILVITVGADPRVRPIVDPGVRPDIDPHVHPNTDLFPNISFLEGITVGNQVAPAGAGAHMGAPLRGGLAEIVQWYKTMTTNAYIRGVEQSGWTPFPGKLWQRNYYEHIIRDDVDLERIRLYIGDNPFMWAMDNENPIQNR